MHSVGSEEPPRAWPRSGPPPGVLSYERNPVLQPPQARAGRAWEPQAPLSGVLPCGPGSQPGRGPGPHTWAALRGVSTGRTSGFPSCSHLAGPPSAVQIRGVAVTVGKAGTKAK